MWGGNFGGLCHFERSEKPIEFKIRFIKAQTRTLNSWILRQRLSMTSKKICGVLGGFGGFGVVSLREFAKRERANSWQSKGKFAFKFVDCHARFVRSQ